MIPDFIVENQISSKNIKCLLALQRVQVTQLHISIRQSHLPDLTALVFLQERMSRALLWIMLALLVVPTIPQKTDGQYEQWCIADEQTPDDVLQHALDWACGNGADCTKIQVNQPCYIPSTVKDHASYAFNSYFQKFKHKGGSCYFKGAAMITELDPSHKYCHYELLP